MEPHRRFPDAGALASDLERFLEGHPILARPSSAFEQLGRWCRRNHRVAVLGAAVLVLLVTVAITSSVSAVDLARAHRAAIAAFRRTQRSSAASEMRGRAAITDRPGEYAPR
jgi:eukaryotic-like serine/threonine-protein kinase